MYSPDVESGGIGEDGQMDDKEPVRLHSRLRLPDGEQSLSDWTWPPAEFYRQHPEYQRGELIFDPDGSNDALVAELMIRGKAHAVRGPFLITDVLFPDEADRILEDVVPIRRQLDEICNEPSELQRVAEYRNAYNFRCQQAEDAAERADAKAILKAMNKSSEVAGSNEPGSENQETLPTEIEFIKTIGQEELERTEIAKHLTPEVLQLVQKVSDDPIRLADIITKIVVEIDKARTAKLTGSSQRINKHTKLVALTLAAEAWEAEPERTKDSVARDIQDYLYGSFRKKFELTTIKEWITPVVPEERKSGGRPRTRDSQAKQ